MEFLKNDVIYSNSQPRLQMTGSLGKTYCIRKWKKLDIENFIIVALYEKECDNMRHSKASEMTLKTANTGISSQ